MRRRVALVVLVATAVACGHVGESDSSSGSTSAPTTSTTLVESSSPSTSAPLSPTPPPATTSPPTTPRPDTTVADQTAPTSDGTVNLGAPNPALLAASLPGDIDWATVGAGWLLIDHGASAFVESAAPDQRGLYLVSPDDVIYGVSALPADGSRVVVVSDDGSQALLELSDPVCAEGCSCPGGAPVTVETDERDDRGLVTTMFGYALLDLATTSLQPVIDPVAEPVCEPGYFLREVDFTADGRGVWVSETWYTDEYRVIRVRLSRVAIDTGVWTTIVDEPVDVDATAAPTTWGISLVQLDDRRIVTSTSAGVWLREADGAPIRELDAPDTICLLDRVWDPDHVLARCRVPSDAFSAPPEVPAEHCHATGLWLIASDGSPSQQLAVRLDDRGYLDCFSGYTYAEQIGDWLAVQVGGDGCSDGVDLIDSDGDVTPWLPDIADSCTETLIGVRNGAWLIGSSSESGGGGIYEVTSHGSDRIDLPSGQITVIGSAGGLAA